jgi:proprotein convertase subtilisin/kexin type 5
MNTTTDLCSCIDGYFEGAISSETCVQCDLSCKTCPNSLSCSSCDIARFRIQNSSLDLSNYGSPFCVCVYRYYSPNSASNCLPCHYSCEVCTNGLATTCLACNALSFRHLDSIAHKCLCNAGYYDGGTVELCLPCNQACSLCYSSLITTCTLCNSTNFLMTAADTCYVNCPAYYFGKSTTKTCELCSTYCLTCLNSSYCT